jgi:ATP/maltotriose-dependent transcriptional regulator MalT
VSGAPGVRLALIRAPTGSGKSTLLSQGEAQSRGSVALLAASTREPTVARARELDLI